MTSTKEKLQRSDCFKLLSACFYSPDLDMLINEDVCGNLTALFEQVIPEAVPYVKQMQQALHSYSEEKLKIAHAELFVGPFELQAPPYGSVYLERNNQVMGKTTLEVIKKYQESGLKLDIKEPADHIAIELEFMHYLYTLEAEALDSGNNAKVQSLASIKNDFLSIYLAPWIPKFCAKIRATADNIFYRSLADCLENFIEHEAATLPLINADGATKHACQATV
jgi:TorA maturation chaperone TorD